MQPVLDMLSGVKHDQPRSQGLWGFQDGEVDPVAAILDCLKKTLGTRSAVPSAEKRIEPVTRLRNLLILEKLGCLAWMTIKRFGQRKT